MIYPANETNIAMTAAALARGELAALPTETVYGLGASAFKPESCARIFEVKGRPAFDPLIVHVPPQSDLDGIVSSVPPYAAFLMEQFWPGPLTLVLPRGKRIPDIVTSGLETVAVRMSSHPVMARVLTLLGEPVAAPSANPFGFLSPTTALHVSNYLGDKVPVILDGGACSIGLESTIIDCSGPDPIVLRAGGLAIESIQLALAEVFPELTLGRSLHSSSQPKAPGMLTQHYAPRVPLHLVDTLEPWTGSRTAAVLAFTGPVPAGYACSEVLSPRGDLLEAACNLFAALHRLDESGVQIIHAEAIPSRGLGIAIMDRLSRASLSRK